MEVPYSDTFNNFTEGLSVWIKIWLDEINGIQTIVENGNEKGFAILVNSRWWARSIFQCSKWRVTVGLVFMAVVIPVNQWHHHVALTYSPGNLKLYQNGILINEGNNASGNIINNDGDLWIGRYHQYDNHFKGYIDEVSSLEQHIKFRRNYFDI